MKRVNNRKFRYLVEPGELITFAISPIETNALIVAAKDGQALENQGDDAQPLYTFSAAQEADQFHFVMLECAFADGPAETARYTIKLSGSAGGTFEDFSPITAKSIVKDPMFRFQIAAGDAS